MRGLGWHATIAMLVATGGLSLLLGVTILPTIHPLHALASGFGLWLSILALWVIVTAWVLQGIR